MSSTVLAALTVFLVSLLHHPAKAFTFSEKDTVMENFDTVFGLAIAFLVLCVIVLLVAIIVPMILHSRIGAKKNPDRVGSKYKLEHNSPMQMGIYGGYKSQPVGQVFVPGNNGMDSAYATLSREDRPQGDDGHYATIQTPDSTLKTAKSSAAGAAATYENPAYEDMNGDGLPDDYDYIGDVAPSAQYENPDVAVKQRDTAAYDNIVITEPKQGTEL